MTIAETPGTNWNNRQVLLQAAVCLVLGVAIGFFLRGSQAAVPPQVGAQTASSATSMAQVTPDQLRQMAAKQAEPLLAQLQSQPNDPHLLARLGQIYYATHDFAQAAQYYRRSLAAKDDSALRIELGRADYYSADPVAALADFEQVLRSDPGNANALYNVGLIKWQSQYDVKGAVAAWQLLLQKNPNHPHRAEVEELIARAKQHSGIAQK